MSGLMDKVKDKVSSGGSGGASGNQPSGIEKGVNSQVHKPLTNTQHTEVDSATDRAGLGDKYDDKINKFADGQVNKRIPGMRYEMKQWGYQVFVIGSTSCIMPECSWEYCADLNGVQLLHNLPREKKIMLTSCRIEPPRTVVNVLTDSCFRVYGHGSAVEKGGQWYSLRRVEKKRWRDRRLCSFCGHMVSIALRRESRCNTAELLKFSQIRYEMSSSSTGSSSPRTCPD
ncbi:uncharacterized protein MYCFIDRAFT_179938 [Pseudocercospora fijiensis CIRAD86]|uniref:Uncharacterized protein n=1 Tax=Pseudocercospora fijiensis (strain CIRAD86) TaxID=383855 RepID=M3AIS0_PSEFD|nr:uncharacterized protein MYCFIDRAFT_179938 [Pseudocercospora fijiensis CIRAD86]EME77362.1 hypothetical protein MYCFIDRAFT_179938 [Pseudocercospora fijiensis CIRAD86]